MRTRRGCSRPRLGRLAVAQQVGGDHRVAIAVEPLHDRRPRGRAAGDAVDEHEHRLARAGRAVGDVVAVDLDELNVHEDPNLRCGSVGETEAALERHHWNTSFTWEDREGPFRRVTDDQAAQFDRDGYVVIEDLIDADTLAAVTDEIDGFEAKVEAFLKTQPDERMMIAEAGALTFTLHIASRSKVLRDLVASPALVDLCADLIGPDVNLYWDQAVYKKPEKPRRFPWHQDNGYTFIEPQQYLTIWLALTDATLDNGCPRVAPGLHKLRHAGALLRRAAGLRVLHRSAARSGRAGEGRWRGGVLVVHAAPHRAEPHRRRAQGVHRAVRAGGRVHAHRQRQRAVRRPRPSVPGAARRATRVNRIPIRSAPTRSRRPSRSSVTKG